MSALDDYNEYNARAERQKLMGKPEVMAQRKTADEKVIKLWTDGLVTVGLGFTLKGVGRGRSVHERRKDVEAGWLVMAEVELYDLDEVPRLVKAARKAVRQNSLPPREFMLRTFDGERFRRTGAVVQNRR